jgi:hypothetical protein
VPGASRGQPSQLRVVTVFGSIFDKATGFLDKRFVLNLLLPSLAFWGGLAILAVQGAGWNAASGWWTARSGLEQVLVVGSAVTGLVFFAFVVAGQVTSLTRLWEGYWPGGTGSWLASRRIARHTARWERLDTNQDVDYMRRFYGFPVRKADVLPTRLGNVLRAAEDYSGDDERYGMDAVFYWPRLYLVLPADTRTLVEDYRSGLDRMVLAATLAALYPLASLAVLVIAHTSLLAWVISAAGALLVATAAYQAAVGAAVAFGDVVRSCFDLYRLSLLQQLGLARPASLEDERQLWGTLKQQLYQRGADDPSLLIWAAGQHAPDV